MHFGLGYLYWKQKQYEEAEAEFKSELSVDPDNAQALAHLGDIAFKKDDPDTFRHALLSSKASCNRARTSASRISILGAILTQQGHYEEAIAELKRAVELDPDQPDAHYRLGRVYQATGKQAAAQKEFTRVRELHEKTEEDVARKMSAAPPPLPQ